MIHSVGCDIKDDGKGVTEVIDEKDSKTMITISYKELSEKLTQMASQTMQKAADEEWKVREANTNPCQIQARS